MSTVIFSNFQDKDTLLLKNIWKNIHIDNLVEINLDTKTDRNLVDNAIKNEKELLIMCGHGSKFGLFSPNFFETYLVDSKNVELIKAKQVIGIWCHASEFAFKHNLKGFFSGMFISNLGEALANGIIKVDNDTIHRSELEFCDFVNKLIIQKEDMSNWIDLIKTKTLNKNKVASFNYDLLRYYN